MAAPAPPPGLNYIAAIRPSLNLILIHTPLGAVLVPLIITLFFFSTSQSRRHPVFILNILACFCGICDATLNIVLVTKEILFPLQPISKALLTSAVAFSIISALFIESIILFRILAFYPLSLTPKKQLVAIFALPIMVKSARFFSVVMYLHQFTQSNGNANALSAAQTSWAKSPYIVSSWSLEMIDNIYASVFLLYNIYQFGRKRQEFSVIRSKSLLAHLRNFFFIALGNFVFPIFMNIAAVILVFTNPSLIDGSYVLIANIYVTIYGVVFATIWTRRQNWNRERVPRSIDFQLKENNQAISSTFDPGVIHTRTVLSTLHFGVESNEGERTDVQRTSTERKQCNPDSDIRINNWSDH